jgi:peptide/nickel transport system substrate-binding protein
MNNKIMKLMALVLALVMVVSMFAGCKKADDATTTESNDVTTESNETTEDNSDKADTLVFATATFGQKFSTFFATTAYDMDVVDLTTGGLLMSDREGNIVRNGIEGETIPYNGTDYTYYGMGDVEVVENDDGTVDYNLTMRDDIVFSDGEPANIDDVIFGIYVMADPTYDGSNTIYAVPIEGMDAYRGGMEALTNVILEAGPDAVSEKSNKEDTEYFWNAFNAAGEKFCQSIADYVIANYGAEDFKSAVEMWGYEAEDTATMWQQIIAKYGYDITDNGINAEKAEKDFSEYLNEELGDKADMYAAGVSTGDSAANISGIERTGDYSMTVHCTKFDATAIYNMSFPIAPLHYYGDPSAYDYENNQFGFTKGDLSIVKSKTSQPLGCGPYTFDSYENGVVTLVANPSYFKGEPKIKYIRMVESVDADYVPGIQSGTFDLATPSISADTVKALEDGNSNGELSGDVTTTALVDYRGYGYIGINADVVKVGSDGGSDASKDLRKALMTVMAIHRDTVIDSYYGERAAVIQYPISNTSWAAPRPTDEGYENCYSRDVDGNPIYTDGMTEEEKYDAALQAAVGFLKAAGYTFDDNGVITAAPEGAETSYEMLVPGSGQGDHPAYGVALAASEQLKKIGFDLVVNDVESSVWNDSLEANTAQLWCAAWQATADPDMYQIYYSANAHGEGTNSNHYQITDSELDTLIVDARSSSDNAYRKATYKTCFDIILDWGVELPLYQRKDCTVASTVRVNVDTLPKDMTPYWSWDAEIETLEMN